MSEKQEKIEIELTEKRWNTVVINALELLENGVIDDLERHKEVYETKKAVKQQLPNRSSEEKSSREKAKEVLKDYN